MTFILRRPNKWYFCKGLNNQPIEIQWNDIVYGTTTYLEFAETQAHYLIYEKI